MQNIKTLIFILYIIFTATVFSQEVINTAGGSTLINSTYYDFSIGETIIETGTNVNLFITQGLLQPSQITTPISNQLTFNDFQVFPNPSQFEINLKNNFGKAIVNFTLIDEAGKTILNKNQVEIDKGSVEKINVSQIAAGNYFLKIELSYNQEKYEGTYKVLKIK